MGGVVHKLAWQAGDLFAPLTGGPGCCRGFLGGGVLWRAERQTVVRIERPAPAGRMEPLPGSRRHPGDPDGRLAVVPSRAPRDSGPVRLNLAVSLPVLLVSHDDAGWCAGSGLSSRPAASLVLA